MFLPTIVKSPLSRPRLLDTLYPLVPHLQSAISSWPAASPTVSQSHCSSGGVNSSPQLVEVDSQQDLKQSVVGVWTRESPHNYDNNTHITEEFVCPSATKFVVEFDSRCVTERRYDYLEFTDVTGAKQKFDGKFNSEHWPRVGVAISMSPSTLSFLQTAEFPGPKLQFLFHSDGSNNEWGYLFTVSCFPASEGIYIIFPTVEGLWTSSSFTALAARPAALLGTFARTTHLCHSLYEDK